MMVNKKIKEKVSKINLLAAGLGLVAGIGLSVLVFKRNTNNQKREPVIDLKTRVEIQGIENMHVLKAKAGQCDAYIFFHNGKPFSAQIIEGCQPLDFYQ